MDAFIERNYSPRKGGARTASLPYWDYRSCRSLSNSSSGVSSCSSIDDVRHFVDSFEDSDVMQPDSNPQPPSASVEPRVSLVFLPGADGLTPALDLYQPFVDLINPNIQILASANQNPLQHDSTPSVDDTLDMPCSALTLFLQEDRDVEVDRLARCTEYLATPPWKFHHREWISGDEQSFPRNCQDYYMCHDDLPLCCTQQIVHGEEVLRVVKFVTVERWSDNIQFYSQILGQQPDVSKADFVIFTLEHHAHFDVQFSLKKLPKEVVPRSTRQMVLSFKVHDIGALVPLLHAECHQMNSTHWVTVDFDGNEVFIEQSASQGRRTFMGFHPGLQSIEEDIQLPEIEATFSELDDDSSVLHASDRFRNHHQVLTSTPLTNKTGQHAPMRSRTSSHQHTDSGFSETRSEQSSRSDIRSMIGKLGDMSVTEDDIDMTVRSAYNGRRRPPSYHHAIRNADRLRPGHVTQHRSRVAPVEIDSKQTFTQLWVMNGHQETGHQSDQDAQSMSSCSSVETAVSDPVSDRGVCFVARAPHRGILLNQGLSRATSMPSVVHPDSASVSSSGSSGTRKSKSKSVKFSEHITEVTISPRVTSNGQADQSRSSLPNALRRIRVQNVINQIGQPTPQKKTPQKANTPARLAKLEERNKAKLGFWI